MFLPYWGPSPTTTNRMERPQNDVCPKCNSGFEDKDLAVRCDGCANWHHMRCAPMTKAAFDAIGKNDNIHWFCPDCDHKIMSFISKIPKYSERRDRECHDLSQTVEELSSLTKELKGLDVKKKLELFEGVTTCIGPKNQHLQDTVQKVDRAMSTVCNQNSWSKVVSSGIQTKSAVAPFLEQSCVQRNPNKTKQVTLESRSIYRYHWDYRLQGNTKFLDYQNRAFETVQRD